MKLRALSVLIPMLCASSLANANLVITEVLYDAPNSDTTEEFVELYNTTCSDISLSGYSLHDNSGSFSLSGTIGGGQYITVARSSSGFSGLFGQAPTLSGMNLALGNSGDKVELRNGGSVVDMVAWENYVSGWSINAKNVSIYRNSTTDTDSNSNWSVSSSAGQPGSGVYTGCDGSGGGNGGGGNGGGSNELTNGQTVSNLSATSGNKLEYTIDVPANASNLEVTMSGGSGDADLYTKYGTAPTSSNYDCRPYKSGNNEYCQESNPQTGKHYIDLVAYSSFSGVSLSASFSEGTGGGGGGGGNGGGTNPGGYYDSAIGLSGSQLKSKLNQIIKTGHNRMSYSEVWTALMYTDQDPNNLDNVILLYTARSEHKNFRAGQTNDQNAWNREHVWAKSHGFPSSGQWGYTDIHHLRPSDVSVNSKRGNKDFDNGGSQISEAPGNYTDSDTFEPMDSVKGDVARMVMYMDVRYEGGDSSGTPDLEISNSTTSTGQPLLGKKCVLLQWHQQDPVSDWEKRRNDRAYELQGNRNPFIDNPQWVADIYGQC